MSWTRNGSQVRPISSLQTLYEMLFRSLTARERGQAQRTMADEKSILDLVREQTKRFQQGLGQAQIDPGAERSNAP
ncbi:MAG: DUF1552 domain-containing protein [Planctomycetota bacterium]